MKTITVLPNNEIKYVKSIIFMVELFGRLYTGKIVYKRVPSDNYKKNIQPRIDDIDAVVKSGKTSWRVFTKVLPLYLTNSKDTTLFQNEGSFIYYDLDREQDMISLEPQLLSEVTVF